MGGVGIGWGEQEECCQEWGNHGGQPTNGRWKEELQHKKWSVEEGKYNQVANKKKKKIAGAPALAGQ